MSRQWGPIGLRSLLGLGLMLGIAQAGRLTRGTTETGAQLRVAVRTRATSADRCRDRTEAELQQMPAHMRQKKQCDRGWINYTFAVEIDGRLVDQRVVTPAGAFGDRPLVLSSLTPVAPGEHNVVIRLSPELPPDISAPVSDLSFEQRLSFQPGRSLLVSLEPSGHWDVIGEHAP